LQHTNLANKFSFQLDSPDNNYCGSIISREMEN
jgi:hypothetical protein